MNEPPNQYAWVEFKSVLLIYIFKKKTEINKVLKCLETVLILKSARNYGIGILGLRLKVFKIYDNFAHFGAPFKCHIRVEKKLQTFRARASNLTTGSLNSRCKFCFAVSTKFYNESFLLTFHRQGCHLHGHLEINTKLLAVIQVSLWILLNV